MKKISITGLLSIFCLLNNYGQTLHFEGRDFEICNVKSSVVTINGEKLLKVERDLEKLAFDESRMETTVDEPTFVKLKNFSLENGVIELKVWSQLEENAPHISRGFIGLAFHIDSNNTAFEAIYLRPTNGRTDDQIRRNHTIQYFAYPDYKFDKLRKEEFWRQYETYADIGLGEWIKIRIEIKNKHTQLYLNNQQSPAFIVN